MLTALSLFSGIVKGGDLTSLERRKLADKCMFVATPLAAASVLAQQ